MRAIHQFLPDLSPGDAVSGHTLAIQAELRAMGLESEVYSHTTHPSLVERAQPYQRYQGSAGGDVRLLYHLAIGSVVADFVLARPEGLLVTCSCSGKVSREAFEEMVLSAAADAKRPVQILERRGAGLDHPVLGGLPETEYLKAFFVRVLL